MKKKRILLVEDNAVLLETTSAFLEGEGFRVQAADDGRRGLDLALKEAIYPLPAWSQRK